jgi:hypothetical protein
MEQIKETATKPWYGPVLAIVVLLVANVGVSHAQTTTNTLHLCNDALTDGGVYNVNTSCTPDVNIGGVVLGTTGNTSPTIGIVRSPDTNHGLPATTSLDMAVFVPNNVSGAGSLSFYVNFGGTSTKATLAGGSGGNAQWTSSTPELFDQSSTKLGFLGTAAGGSMLGYAQTCNQSCGPNTQINQFLGGTQAAQRGMGSTATGYFVYLVTVNPNIQFPTTNQFTFTTTQNGHTPFNFAVGTIFYSFLNGADSTNGCSAINGVTPTASRCVQDTTAASSALMIVPEPGSLVLLGSGLLVIGGTLRRRLTSPR